MASRENQGLQVALILFVMMTVVLMVTTYMFYRKAEENRNDAAAARSATQAAQSERDKAIFKNQVLMFMVGKGDLTREQVVQQLPSDPEMATMFADFDKDMKMYGAGLNQDELNYPSLPKRIIEAIQKKNNELTVRTKQSTDLSDRMAQVTKDETAKTAIATKGQVDADNKLQQAQAAFQAKVAEFQSKQDENFAKIQTVSAKVTEVSQKASAQISQKDKVVKSLETQNLSLKDKLLDKQPRPPKEPDGMITLSSTEGEFVLIDMGSEDNLKVRTTFNVYPAGEVSIKTAKIKGKIEVVEVLGQHRAKARVTYVSNVIDPVLRGDVIFSEVFRRGQRLHIALAGKMDLNKDGLSDREYIKNILINNGAVIDAELRDDGTAEGRITDQTTYLIIGERPTAETNKAYMTEWNHINGRAAELGIQDVTIGEIFRLIGWHPESRKVSLGEKANAAADIEDFQPRRPLGASGAGAAAPY